MSFSMLAVNKLKLAFSALTPQIMTKNGVELHDLTIPAKGGGATLYVNGCAKACLASLKKTTNTIDCQTTKESVPQNR